MGDWIGESRIVERKKERKRKEEKNRHSSGVFLLVFGVGDRYQFSNIYLYLYLNVSLRLIRNANTDCYLFTPKETLIPTPTLTLTRFLPSFVHSVPSIPLLSKISFFQAKSNNNNTACSISIPLPSPSPYGKIFFFSLHTCALFHIHALT